MEIKSLTVEQLNNFMDWIISKEKKKWKLVDYNVFKYGSFFGIVLNEYKISMQLKNIYNPYDIKHYETIVYEQDLEKVTKMLDNLINSNLNYSFWNQCIGAFDQYI